MPELPEVETIRSGLQSHVSGKKIVGIDGKNSRIFRNNLQGLGSLQEILPEKKIGGIDRRGKFMWIYLLDDKSDKAVPGDKALVVHLGMSGQIRTASKIDNSALSKHEHLRIITNDGLQIKFIDPRTFGHITVSTLVEEKNFVGGNHQVTRLIPEAISHIGMDPLEESWDSTKVVAKGKRSRRIIKTLLLDQALVSGIGNIYADEGLFRAGIHGTFLGADLSVKQWEQVLDGCAEAMGEALEAGGTSFDALYVDVEGNPGYFSRFLAVYGREGAPCVRCQTPLERLVLDGRSHFYCPSCQRT